MSVSRNYAVWTKYHVIHGPNYRLYRHSTVTNACTQTGPPIAPVWIDILYAKDKKMPHRGIFIKFRYHDTHYNTEKILFHRQHIIISAVQFSKTKGQIRHISHRRCRQDKLMNPIGNIIIYRVRQHCMGQTTPTKFWLNPDPRYHRRRLSSGWFYNTGRHTIDIGNSSAFDTVFTLKLCVFANGFSDSKIIQTAISSNFNPKPQSAIKKTRIG